MSDRVISLTPGGLGRALKRDAREFPKEVLKGLRSSARQAEALLAKLWPVFTGQSKAQWDTKDTLDGAEVDNDSPYAGVIEEGARPHPIGPDGMVALEQWVETVLGDQVESIAGQRKAYGKGLKADRPGRAYTGELGPGQKARAGSGKNGRALKADFEHEAVQELAFLIARKIGIEGQEGKFIVEHALPLLEQYLAEAVEQYIGKHHDRRGDA